MQLIDLAPRYNYLTLNFFKLNLNLCRTDGGVDPRSPQGTAAAFTKPTLDALERANTSHLYEMASEELFR
jgi:hypothetical protein